MHEEVTDQASCEPVAYLVLKRVTEAVARSLGQVMPTAVVQEHHNVRRCGPGLCPALLDRLGADEGGFSAPTASCCLQPAVGSDASASSPPRTPPCGSLPSHAAPAAAFSRFASRRRPQVSVPRKEPPLRPRAPLDARRSDVPEAGRSVIVSWFFSGGGGRAPPSPVEGRWRIFCSS